MKMMINSQMMMRMISASYHINGAVSAHSLSPNTQTDPMMSQTNLKMRRRINVMPRNTPNPPN